MIQRFKFGLVTLLVTGAVWLAPAVRADEWDKETILSFNEPVEIPGRVLPAGTYVFKLADSESDRNIVQVFTENQKYLLTTILAIPASRPEPKDSTVVTFEERPSGSPEAVHSWFYPGDTTGLQFVYPKSDREFAVKAVPTSLASATPAPKRVMTIQPPVERPTAAAPDPAVETVEEDVLTAQAAPAPADNAAAVQTDSTPTPAADTLPETAGNFAVIPFLGLVLLSGGFTAIRFATKRN